MPKTKVHKYPRLEIKKHLAFINVKNSKINWRDVQRIIFENNEDRAKLKGTTAKFKDKHLKQLETRKTTNVKYIENKLSGYFYIHSYKRNIMLACWSVGLYHFELPV